MCDYMEGLYYSDEYYLDYDEYIELKGLIYFFKYGCNFPL